MCSWRLLLLTALAVAGLGYYLYVPFPETARNRMAKTVDVAMFRLFSLYIPIGEFLGIGEEAQLFRSMFKALVSDNGAYEKVEVSRTEIEDTEVMVIRPVGSKEDILPGIVYFHGGGWVISDVDIYKPLTAQISSQAGAVVVSVNYRLAPEFPFPVPFEDCLKVTRYLLKHGKQYGVDPTKIGIAGDSAGGNLAMAVGVYLGNHREENLPPLRVQGLFYPAVQAFDFNLPSYLKNEYGPTKLTKSLMVKFWLYYFLGSKSRTKEFYNNGHTSTEIKRKYSSYVDSDLLPKSFQGQNTGRQDYESGNKTLSDEIEALILDSRLAPLMASKEELANAPPSYIISCEFDPLRDDAFLAYERLRNSRGSLVEHKYYEQEEHGFLQALDDVAINALQSFIDFFKNTMDEEN